MSDSTVQKQQRSGEYAWVGCLRGYMVHEVWNLEVLYQCYFSEANHVVMAQTAGLWDACQS